MQSGGIPLREKGRRNVRRCVPPAFAEKGKGEPLLGGRGSPDSPEGYFFRLA